METQKDERWYVQLDSSEVKLMTLEELDHAFESGLIHENTFVIQVGETQWQTLAEVAGLSDDAEEEEEEAQAAAPAPAAPAQAQYAQAQYAQAQYAQAQHAQAQYAQNPYAQVPMHQGQPMVSQGQPMIPRNPVPQGMGSMGALTAQQARPVTVAQGSWPPVVSAPQAVRPSVGPGSSQGIGPLSVIPVVQDVDLDLGAPSFKSGKRNLVIAGMAFVMILGGGGYALTRLDAPPQPTRAPAAAAAPAPPPARPSWSSPTPASAPAPASAPTTTTSTTASTGSGDSKSDTSSSTGKLSEDMKRALLAQDQSRPKSSKSKASAAPRRSTGKSKSSGSGGFRAGGSDHDPLNSKL